MSDLDEARRAYFEAGGVESQLGPLSRGAEWYWRRAAKLWRDRFRHADANRERVEAERDEFTERSELQDDVLRGLRIAHELTLETQTVEEMAADLVRLVKMAREQRDALQADLDSERSKVIRLCSCNECGSPMWSGEDCVACAKKGALRKLAAAYSTIEWMAEEYADAGGSSGPERRAFDEAHADAQAAIAALKEAP